MTPDEYKDLRPARSQAELTRVRQGWLLIGIASISMIGTLSLVIDKFL